MNDQEVARKYISKIESCKRSRTEFDLSFAQFKRIMNADKCRYTGIKLTNNIVTKRQQTDVTIDRVNNSKGYITGNVVACCHGYNEFKGVLENPNHLLGFNTLEKALKIQKKLQGGTFND